MKSTEIHTLRTRWLDQVKAMASGTGNLTRRQKHISGRAGRVAWSIMSRELAALCRTRRRTFASPAFAQPYGENK